MSSNRTIPSCRSPARHDHIQSQVSGEVNPETWTHGSAEQRAEWFNVGLQSGNLDNCDTFGGVRLASQSPGV